MTKWLDEKPPLGAVELPPDPGSGLSPRADDIEIAPTNAQLAARVKALEEQLAAMQAVVRAAVGIEDDGDNDPILAAFYRNRERARKATGG